MLIDKGVILQYDRRITDLIDCKVGFMVWGAVASSVTHRRGVSSTLISQLEKDLKTQEEQC